jgi:hypothetical protein
LTLDTIGEIFEGNKALFQGLWIEDNEEKFFHALIHLIFTMVGTDVHYELHTPLGSS